MDEAMIRAGVEVLINLPYGSDPRVIVEEVYKAMLEAHCQIDSD